MKNSCMKFLITGGLGFIGSNFVRKILQNEENQIINIDNELAGSNHKSLSDLENNSSYNFVKGDITDKVIMKKIIEECDIIVNFAAESHVDRSISTPRPFIDSNILGVFNILEILRDVKRKLIHISTDEVFGNIQNDSATENFRFNPSSPYSASKASAELLINAYSKTFGINAIVTRCTNNYGPRQFLEKLIPKTIIFAEKNFKIPIYGKGTSKRDWIYVLDHCEAIQNIIEKGNVGETYNISSGNELDNITVVKKILNLMNKSEDLIEYVDERPGEDERYSLDSSKIQDELKWNCKIDFDTGINLTIQWYLNNKYWWKDMNMSKLKQISWMK